MLNILTEKDACIYKAKGKGAKKDISMVSGANRLTPTEVILQEKEKTE